MVVPFSLQPRPTLDLESPLVKKLNDLRGILKEMGTVLVAFSGGVDSTCLLKVACEVLGENALGVTAVSPSLPGQMIAISKDLARQMNARHHLIHTFEVEKESYTDNPPNRCYFCKEELYTRLVGVAKEYGMAWIIDGNNKSDEGDWRPGRQAAHKMNVRSPLWEAGLLKDEIRQISRHYGLVTWDEPASACLSSRFPYGEKITPEKLKMVEEGEGVLKEMGLRQFRLRHHSGNLARIEVDSSELPIFSKEGFSEKVSVRLKKIGYHYVALDLEEYRSGRLNELLQAGPSTR